MNREEILIRDLESWAAQIVALYENAEDMEGADDLQAVVKCYTDDIRRKMQSVTGKLADLANLKRGIRLAAFLLQAIQDDEPDAMAGWRYMATPQNIVQDTYAVVYGIVQELTCSVVAIEREYPDLAEEFARERAAYRASLDQFEAETRV